MSEPYHRVVSGSHIHSSFKCPNFRQNWQKMFLGSFSLFVVRIYDVGINLRRCRKSICETASASFVPI